MDATRNLYRYEPRRGGSSMITSRPAYRPPPAARVGRVIGREEKEEEEEE